MAAYRQKFDMLSNGGFDAMTNPDFGQPLLRVQSLAYIRGMHFEDSIIIVDEVQNLTRHQVKTLLTRVSNNSKIILMGDCSEAQIDSKECNPSNNGLIHLINRCKDCPIFAYIQTNKVLGGPVPKMAVELL